VELIPFVDLKAQYRALSAEIDVALRRVMESTSFIMGPDVEKFEEEFATYCGARHCVGVGSGTAALKLALQACGVGAGDEVILPANTYIATALAVSQVGATPVLVDIDEDYLIDPQLMEAAVTQRTKAVILVHLFGLTIPESTIDIARELKLRVIEDACQAHGAMIGTRRAGAIGDAGCFSFYPGKNLGAYGDGGAVVTNDPAIADTVRLLRDFGQRKKYEHLIKGDNCRLDTMQAAILRVKLQHLDSWNQQRIRAADRYFQEFSGLDITFPRIPNMYITFMS
jgi:dTDP-4-amino-4,6-dideoxygalactose transaminase